MKNALAAILLIPAIAFAAERADSGKQARPFIPGVNWESRTIRATGKGAPSLKAPSIAAARIGAEKAAEMDALRNILQTVQGVQLNSETRVGEALSSNGELKSKVEGTARGFRRVDTRFFSDGGVEIDVEMSIEDLLADVLPAQEEPQKVTIPTKGELQSTGLVVDAKSLNPTPALSPRLLDESGKVVYEAAFVTREALKANGIAGYLKSVEQARQSARVGQKPRLVKALRLAGPSDLVISDADASRLRDPEGNASFLAEGRVIIVVD
ncbi:MAG TPA: hypothetical protein DFS52_15165 [Myxococcales bacterium]|nr:hypothetical protein [Myxococcales bacterium]